MRAMLQGVVGLGLVALLGGPGLAQGRARRLRHDGRRRRIAMLIGNESVQKELKLDDTQVTKAKELADKNREKMMAAREETKDLDQEERRKKMTELNKEMNESTLKAVGEFFKPEQIDPAHQISYQARGAHGVRGPRNRQEAEHHGCPEGRDQDDHRRIADAAMRELRQGFQDDREGTMKKMAEHHKETSTRSSPSSTTNSRKPGKR